MRGAHAPGCGSDAVLWGSEPGPPPPMADFELVTAAAHQPRWRLLALGISGVLIIYGAWQVSNWPASDRGIVGDAFLYPLALAAIWGFWRASNRCSAQPRLRSAWRLLALGGLCCLAGDAAQSIYELSGHCSSRRWPTCCSWASIR